MIIRHFLIGAAGLLFISSQSLAADIYTDEGSLKDEPVYYAPVFNWAGLYAGVHGGYARGDASHQFENKSFFNDDGGTSAVDPFTPFDLDPEGGLGGVHIGYNFQRGNVVFGVEGTISASDIDDKIDSQFFPGFDTFETSIGAFGTVAARLGYAWDRTLLYAKGGYAAADVKFKANSTVPAHLEDDEMMHGYVLGAGVEHALTDRWIIGLEYNYVDLGSKQFSGRDSFGDEVDLDTELDFHTLAARLSYKFGAETAAPLK